MNIHPFSQRRQIDASCFHLPCGDAHYNKNGPSFESVIRGKESPLVSISVYIDLLNLERDRSGLCVKPDKKNIDPVCARNQSENFNNPRGYGPWILPPTWVAFIVSRRVDVDPALSRKVAERTYSLDRKSVV